MWCNHCQQDVPGVTFSANQAVIGCARCGHVFRGSEHDSVEFLPIQNAPEMAVAESREPDLIDSNLSPLDEFHDFGDEDFEQALADAQRLLEPSQRRRNGNRIRLNTCAATRLTTQQVQPATRQGTTRSTL
jgi:hypothetical protein